MMPIVFCASFAPWFRLKNAADTSCARRNQRSTRDGGTHRNSQKIDVMRRRPSTIPISGDKTMNTSVLVQPLARIEPQPAFATAAPAYPPMSACDELVG